jgi:hypothetical protein
MVVPAVNGTTTVINREGKIYVSSIKSLRRQANTFSPIGNKRLFRLVSNNDQDA